MKQSADCSQLDFKTASSGQLLFHFKAKLKATSETMNHDKLILHLIMYLRKAVQNDSFFGNFSQVVPPVVLRIDAGFIAFFGAYNWAAQ